MAEDGLIPSNQLSALFRQRRQLLIVTFLLIAIHSGVVKTTDADITLSGLKIAVEKLDLVVFSLWCAFLYSAWRYTIHIQSLPLDKIDAEEKRFVWKEAALIMTPIILQQAKGSSAIREKLANSERIRIGVLTNVSLNATDDGGALLKNVQVQSYNDENRFVGNAVGMTTKLDSAQVRIAIIRGKRKFALVHPAVSDLYAPFFIAALAPLALAWSTVWPHVSALSQ